MPRDRDEGDFDGDGDGGGASFTRFCPVFPNFEWLDYLLPLGIEMVHLRLENDDEDLIRDQIRRSLDLCDSNDATLVVNDHWQLAIEEEAGFVHLGQEDLDDADLDAIRAAGIRLGISTRDHLDLDRALMLDPAYVLLSPIQKSRTRAGNPLGLETVAEWRELAGNVPVYAAGGITPDNAMAILDAGADAVCVTSDITGHDDPEARVLHWLELTR